MSDDDEDLGDKTMIMAPGAARKLVSALKARLKCSNTGLLGIGPGSEIVLEGGEVTLGRGSENTIALQADGVSRTHARVYAADQGWRIEDLGSTNGIRVNGQKVDKADLKHGDRLEIGSVPYDFSIDSEAASAVSAEPAFAAKPAAPKPAPAAATPATQKAAASKARPTPRPAKSGGSNAILWLVVLLGAGALGFAIFAVLTQ